MHENALQITLANHSGRGARARGLRYRQTSARSAADDPRPAAQRKTLGPPCAAYSGPHDNMPRMLPIALAAMNRPWAVPNVAGLVVRRTCSSDVSQTKPNEMACKG